MSILIGNHEERFSHDSAHIRISDSFSFSSLFNNFMKLIHVFRLPRLSKSTGFRFPEHVCDPLQKLKKKLTLLCKARHPLEMKPSKHAKVL